MFIFGRGWQWFYAEATFWQAEPTKTRVQELTRTSILGHGHTQAQIVVTVVRVVVVPIGTSGVIRIILPAATAFDAVRTGNSTFFCPYRLTLRLLLICKAIGIVLLCLLSYFAKILYGLYQIS